jgi:hypothetical protein
VVADQILFCNLIHGVIEPPQESGGIEDGLGMNQVLDLAPDGFDRIDLRRVRGLKNIVYPAPEDLECLVALVDRGIVEHEYGLIKTVDAS